VCEKTELDLPFGVTAFNWPQLVKMGLADVWARLVNMAR
jgi:hypothetical protein